MDKRLHIPVLAIRGDVDDYIQRSTLTASAHWSSKLELTEVAGAGHYSHQEQPDDVNRRLVEFLKG
jgi:pimeloyl-ACP methyl ester carboxylesterase